MSSGTLIWWLREFIDGLRTDICVLLIYKLLAKVRVMFIKRLLNYTTSALLYSYMKVLISLI